MARTGKNAIGPILVASALVFLTWSTTAAHYAALLREPAYFAQEPGEELAPYRQRYGPNRNSEFFEEWLIRDFFADRRGGQFLDVGSNHFQAGNNTYYLETQLGWSGIAIDAQEEFAEGYRLHRPKTRFVAMFASDVPGESIELFVPADNRLIASADQEFTKRRGSQGTGRLVPTTTLNDVLRQAGVTSIDFLSMDIELAEPRALAGFAIETYRPSLACVEAHPEVRQQIIDYFTAHHYRLVGKYLRADTKNLYFSPSVTD